MICQALLFLFFQQQQQQQQQQKIGIKPFSRGHFFLFFFLLESCNTSTKVHSTEIKTTGGKNDCNPQTFLQWPVCKSDSFYP